MAGAVAQLKSSTRVGFKPSQFRLRASALRAVTAIPARRRTLVVCATAPDDVNTGFFQKFGIERSDSVTKARVEIPEELKVAGVIVDPIPLMTQPSEGEEQAELGATALMYEPESTKANGKYDAEREAIVTLSTAEAAAIEPEAVAEPAAEVEPEPVSQPEPASAPEAIPEPAAAAPVETMKAPSDMPAGMTTGGGLSQVRVYEQLLALRQRMSSRLSETNRYARFLEGELSRRDNQVRTAQQRMKMMAKESANLASLSEELSGTVQFGVDKEAVSGKIKEFSARLTAMEGLLASDVEGLDKITLQKVPVTWLGVAEEVKLMGSFDNWTRGIELSAEDYSYSGEQTFTADIELLPGEYECKFVVDGMYVLGQGWPTIGNDVLAQNNLLIVTQSAGSSFK